MVRMYRDDNAIITTTSYLSPGFSGMEVLSRVIGTWLAVLRYSRIYICAVAL